MNEILFMIGDLPVRMSAALIGFGVLALLLLLSIAVVLARSGRRGADHGDGAGDPRRRAGRAS